MNDWNNISDDELDDLFRKSADRHVPEFDGSAWEDMTRKLDKGTSAVSKEHGLLRKIIAGGLMLALLGWLAWRGRGEAPESGKTVEMQQNTEASSGSRGEEPRGVSETNASGPPTSGNDIRKVDTTEAVEDASGEESAASPALPAGIKIALGKGKVYKKIVNSIEGQAAPTQAKERYSERKTENERSEAGESARNHILSGSMRKNEEELRNSMSGSRPRKVPDLLRITEGEGLAEPFVERKRLADRFTRLEVRRWEELPVLFSPVKLSNPVLREEISRAAEASSASERGFGLRLMYSPDLTTIGDNKIFRVGNNIGLLGEYRINGKWLIQAGVIRAVKYYGARPDQYKIPGYILRQGADLKGISAACNMLDIPFTVRYDFIRKTTGRWFATAGSTSYLMLKEKYDYNYVNNAAPGIKYRKWEGKTGYYPFGVINASVGYERKLTRRFSLQGEPFVKIPVSNVGYGKVKLVSAGIFISGKIEF